MIANAPQTVEGVQAWTMYDLYGPNLFRGMTIALNAANAIAIADTLGYDAEATLRLLTQIERGILAGQAQRHEAAGAEA